jgi:hypothetical protein
MLPALRFAGMPIQFFLTKDRALLAQYCELRNRVYRRHYPHLAEDFGHEEVMDHLSTIVVGWEERVVAGGRITISRPQKQQLMPMEGDGFRLADALPKFRFDKDPFAEFSRVAVDPSYAQGRRAGLGLIQEMASTAARMGVDLVFSICPAPQVRWNEMNSHKCGVGFHTFPEVEVGAPFRIPMTLCAYTGLIEAHRRPLPLSA